MIARKGFRVRPTGNPTLDQMQQDLFDVLKQLDGLRQGVLAFPARKVNGGEQLGGDAVVTYYGTGAASVVLPAAAGRGPGMAQQITVIALAAGALTVIPSGNDKLLGIGGAYVATVAVGGLGMRLFVSDGVSNWAVR